MAACRMSWFGEHPQPAARKISFQNFKKRREKKWRFRISDRYILRLEIFGGIFLLLARCFRCYMQKALFVNHKHRSSLFTYVFRRTTANFCWTCCCWNSSALSGSYITTNQLGSHVFPGAIKSKTNWWEHATVLSRRAGGACSGDVGAGKSFDTEDRCGGKRTELAHAYQVQPDDQATTWRRR